METHTVGCNYVYRESHSRLFQPGKQRECVLALDGPKVARGESIIAQCLGDRIRTSKGKIGPEQNVRCRHEPGQSRQCVRAERHCRIVIKFLQFVDESVWQSPRGFSEATGEVRHRATAMREDKS